jgi:hypothetical protein
MSRYSHAAQPPDGGSAPRLLALLIIATMPIWCASAAVPADGSAYQLEIHHKTLSLLSRARARHALELSVTVVNHGSQDLYDVRLYLAAVGARLLRDRTQQPARVQLLPAGGQETLVGSFELRDPVPVLEGSSHVVFQVEAVNTTTQEIVTFVQRSTAEDR